MADIIFNAPTQNFVDEFEKTGAGIVDPRLDYTVGRDTMPWFNNRVFDKTWSPVPVILHENISNHFPKLPIKVMGI